MMFPLISLRSLYDVLEQKINRWMTIAASRMGHMIQNSSLQEIQTQHRLGLIQFLNSQVLVHILCNSTSY